MGGRRTNPKYLKYRKQKAGFCAQFMHLAHGNPRGREHGHIITLDGRIVNLNLVPDPVSAERAKVLELREEWAGLDFYQKANPVCFVKVVNSYYPHSLKRSFSETKTFFVEETFEFIRFSIPYSSKEIAMLNFNTGRITWVKKVAR